MLAVDSFRVTKGAARELFFKAQGCASSCRARGFGFFWAGRPRQTHSGSGRLASWTDPHLFFQSGRSMLGETLPKPTEDY